MEVARSEFFKGWRCELCFCGCDAV
jgi:hypothetical protein